MRKKKWQSRLLAASLALSMPLQMSFASVPAFAEQTTTENLALNKPVLVSGYEGGYRDDGTLTYPQFAAANITDGNASTRWSAATDAVEQWCIIDLEEEKTINKVVLNFMECPHYQVQVSTDDENWTTVGEATSSQINTVEKTFVFARTKARYVRLLQLAQRPSGGELYGIGVWEIEIYNDDAVADINLALNQPVTVSGYEGGYKDDGTLTYPQFAASNVTDGSISTRWSAPEFGEEQWCQIDLQNEAEINEIDIYFMECPRYKVQISLDGENYTTVAEVKDGQTGDVARKFKFKKSPARYVRLLQLERRNTNVGVYGMSVYEMEVYAKDNLTYEIEDIEQVSPTLSEDGKSIVLPELEGYDVSLYASSNEAVIAADGSVHQPLCDMDVSVMYQITDKKDPSKMQTASKEAQIHIPGKYQQQAQDNAKPDVLPALREWMGSQGEFTLSKESRIVIADESLSKKAEIAKAYFKETAKQDLEIAVGEAKAGDLYFEIDQESISVSEGYEIEIDDFVHVKAADLMGVQYAGATLSQIFSQNEGTLPKGQIRDYPQYEVRSCFFDCARFYMPLDNLNDLTKYMAYYKLNQIHVHLNDDGGEQSCAFRLESKLYPEINGSLSKDEIYSQEDYKAFQKEALTNGVQVITEIDSPSHAGFAALHDSSLMLDANAIDIRNPEAVQFIKDVIDEFITGDDPVIQGNVLHIGCDEYQRYSSLFDEYRADAAAYYNDIVEHVKSRGYDVRMWNMLGSDVYPGVDLIDPSTVMNYFASYQSNYGETLAAGFPCINSDASWLYIVPENGYANAYSLQYLYEHWEVNSLGGGYSLPKASPQMLGAEPCFWYDIKAGCTQFDIFNEFKKEMILCSEKTWYGESTEDQTTENFLSRADNLAKSSPLANPQRYVEHEGEVVAQYDFESVEKELVRDSSNNGYDAFIDQAALVRERGNTALSLDGNGTLNLPFASMSFPWSVNFDLKLSEENDPNALLFNSDDGKIYANYQGTGKIALEEKGYVYVFDRVIEPGQWTNINISASGKGFTLTIDRHESIDALEISQNSYPYAGFVLPSGRIGQGVHGLIDNIVISDHAGMAGEEDISSVLDGSVIDNRPFANSRDASLLTDHIYGVSNDHNDTSFGSWQNEACDQAEVIIDLGASKTLGQIGFSALNHPAHGVYIPSAEFYISNDPEGEWEKIAEIDAPEYPGLYSQFAPEDRAAILDEKKTSVQMSDVSAKGRYLKVVFSRFNSDAEWMFIDEILMIEKADTTLLSMAIDQAEQLKAQNALEGVNTLVVSEFENALASAKETAANSHATRNEVNEAWKTLCHAIQMLGFKTDFSELDLLIAKAQQIDSASLPYDLAVELEQALEYAIEVRNDPAALTDVSIAQAVSRLKDVLESLPETVEVDLSVLQMLVESVQDEDLDQYVNAGKEEFRQELAKAKAILESPESQQQVDEAVLSLNEAWLNLRLKANESLLNALRSALAQIQSLNLDSYDAALSSSLAGMERRIEAALSNDQLTRDEALILVHESQNLLNQTTGNDFTAAENLKNDQDAVKASSVSTAAKTYGLPSLFAAAGALMLLLKKRNRK